MKSPSLGHATLVSALVSAFVTLMAVSAFSATIWSPTTVPGIVDSGPDNAVEIGVRFRADSAGSVTGVRFYKAATNTGVHVVNLWTTGGTLLATATATNETASGWQQVNFPAPVPISANTYYVASYHTNTGHYSDDQYSFAATGVDSPPLHVPADGASGSNGVFAYGSTSSFPSLGWRSSNYWVDVAFTPTQSSDTTPPTVTSFSIPTTATSLTVPITALAATDNVGVTGYLLTESATAPLSTAAGWSAAPPATYTFASAGTKTLYAWAKDAAGNVSTALSASVTITLQTTTPEPAGWYAGDMHVHRSCGGPPEDITSIYQKMFPQDLAAVSLLADMGNGEVQDPVQDLPRVTGAPDPVSTPGRTVEWDAEWHWDATYTQYPHQALGGHVVSLGLTNAQQIWEEYTYPIFAWAHSQNAIAGFAHMQYLDNNIPQNLDCCTPLEYPVEVALGSADFIEEDVTGSDSAIQAYYRLLNCGFRPGLAAGTDYPCNGGADPGTLLTYVQVANNQMTYRNWIEGIAGGRTVVSRNGHNEFLDLKVNGTASPGDEIKLTGGGSVQVTVTWTARLPLSGTVELVANGVVVASKQASASPDAPVTLGATVNFARSGWLAARRMDETGHRVHTGAVFVTVDNAPVRASLADAEFYVSWMDNLLTKTAVGGAWSSYFTVSRDAAQARYQAAKALFQQIALDAVTASNPLVVTTSLPGAYLNVPYAATLSASGGTGPYSWSLASGSLPAGLSLNGTSGTISGTPTTTGSFPFTVRVTDSGSTAQTVTAAMTIAVSAQTSFTFWPAATVPGIVDSGPDSAVELGVKFRADTGGYVTGVRFYKAATNTGTHIVNLWTTSGTLLATTTVTNETASGWQQAQFPAPVPISANTYYVASYHTNTGHYSDDQYFFASAGIDNSPLHAPADGVSGANGVYAYGGTSTFPTLGWRSSNYWVDVVFTQTPPPDTTAPTVTAFAVPTTATTLTVAITTFTSTDNVGVTGYLVTESATPPSPAASGWTATPPAAYTFATTGTKTLYAFAKDAAGNVSAARSASVTILPPDTTAPTVTAFAVPATATTLTVAITTFTATDNVGVTGYLVTESATPPSSTASGWTASPPATYTFSSPGAKTLYAFAKDAAGNVSAARSATVTVALLDTTAPIVTTFTVPATATTLTVFIGGMSATDDVAVTGYLVTESATPPSPGASGWSTAPPTTYTFSSAGAKSLYGWAKDAAGNVSAGVRDTVTVTLPAGGPILVVTSTANPFSGYCAEILRAEGFPEFAVADVSAVTASLLAPYDVVVLGDVPLSNTQVTIFTNWVNAGGQLIALHPDRKLAPLLGLISLSTSIADGYLLVNSATGPGAGIVDTTIQYHGPADLYALSDATAVATLYASATTATSNPAVTLRSVGTLGGHAAAFTYDLARSVVLTRQGNSAWSGQERDGYPPIRPDDLFYGNASFDPRPDWVDLTKVAIPQADEQQRLLANLIIRMNEGEKELPRFWYFPRGLKAVVVMTGDDHSEGGTAARFSEYMSASPQGCSVADWQCIRSTSYIYPDNPLTDAQAAAYVSAGFEIALHLNTNCADWTTTSLNAFLTNQLAALSGKYPSLPPPATNRTHCIVWSNYAGEAKAELAHGITLDTNYYYWPPSWVANVPGLFTGSGMPMRFADVDGTLLDIYQAATVMTDESGQTYPFTIDTLLDRALGAEGYFGAFVANMHNDLAVSSDADAILASAQARGVPVISARQLLDWTNGRNNSTIGPLDWDGRNLSFSVTAAQGANGLVAMVPMPVGQAVTGVAYNGSPISFTTATVKGVRYAMFSSPTGSYRVTYTPLVLAVSPPDGATGVTTATTVTVNFTAAMDPATVNAGTFELRCQGGSLVAATVTYDAAAQKATLTPSGALANATTYTALVHGGSNGVRTTDGTPLAADYSWSFTTASETVPPTVTSFSLPATSSSLTVPITSFTATDNVGVTGYIVTESATPPQPAATGWSTTPPSSYTFASAGTKTLYAFAKDAAGNVSAGRSATVVITLTGTYSIWSPGTVPGIADSGPDNAVELGIRFRSDVAGRITGIRFYKGSGNTGTHTASLWAANGTLLATTTFTNETATGWQQVNFPTPVPIAANTVYVASYHTSVGHYSDDQYFFATAGVDNPPLHALADGGSGSNGTFAYGSASAFPNLGWRSSNYWVDVVFSP